MQVISHLSSREKYIECILDYEDILQNSIFNKRNIHLELTDIIKPRLEKMFKIVEFSYIVTKYRYIGYIGYVINISDGDGGATYKGVRVYVTLPKIFICEGMLFEKPDKLLLLLTKRYVKSKE